MKLSSSRLKGSSPASVAPHCQGDPRGFFLEESSPAVVSGGLGEALTAIRITNTSGEL